MSPAQGKLTGRQLNGIPAHQPVNQPTFIQRALHIAAHQRFDYANWTAKARPEETIPISTPIYIRKASEAVSWARFVLDQLGLAFRHAGWEVVFLDDTDEDARTRFMKQLGSGAPTPMVDINGRVRFPPGIGNLRKLSLMVDHPLIRHEDYAATPSNVVLGLVDESHIAAAGLVQGGGKRVFLPHAGPPMVPDTRRKPMAERRIPLLFAGSVTPPASKAEWMADNPAAPEFVCDIIFDAAELKVTEALPVLDALTQSAGERGIAVPDQVSPNTLIELVRHAERQAEAHARRTMLDALRKLPLTLVAPRLPPGFDPPPPAWTVMQEIEADALYALYGDTRIVLNPVVKFPYGLHDRICQAFSQGALIATGYTHILDREGAGIDTARRPFFFFDRAMSQSGLADRLGEALATDTGALDARSAEISALYAGRHDWPRRAQEILQHLDLADG